MKQGYDKIRTGLSFFEIEIGVQLPKSSTTYVIETMCPTLG